MLHSSSHTPSCLQASAQPGAQNAVAIAAVEATGRSIALLVALLVAKPARRASGRALARVIQAAGRTSTAAAIAAVVLAGARVAPGVALAVADPGPRAVGRTALTKVDRTGSTRADRDHPLAARAHLHLRRNASAPTSVRREVAVQQHEEREALSLAADVALVVSELESLVGCGWIEQGEQGPSSWTTAKDRAARRAARCLTAILHTKQRSKDRIVGKRMRRRDILLYDDTRCVLALACHVPGICSALIATD